LLSHFFEGRSGQDPLWRPKLGEYGAAASRGDDQGTEIVQRALNKIHHF
jgi:hypothetical protein